MRCQCISFTTSIEEDTESASTPPFSSLTRAATSDGSADSHMTEDYLLLPVHDEGCIVAKRYSMISELGLCCILIFSTA